MRIAERMVTAGLLLFLWASATRADEPGEGSRVRLRTAAAGGTTTGIVESWAADSVVIRTAPGAAPLRFQRSEISTVELSRGKKRHALAGLLGGAVAWGAIVGLTAAFGTLDESGLGEPASIAGLLGLGTGVGALVRTERWEPIAASRASLVLAPSPRGAQLRLAFGF